LRDGRRQPYRVSSRKGGGFTTVGVYDGIAKAYKTEACAFADFYIRNFKELF
jgi:hypothetical protein